MNMPTTRRITRDTLLTLEAYAKIRKSSKPQAITHRRTRSVHLGTGIDTPERLAEALAQVCQREGDSVPANGGMQGTQEVMAAMAAQRGG